MHTGTVSDIEKLIGVSLSQLTAREFEGTSSSATFRLPEDAGKLTAIARELSLAINSPAGSILVIKSTGIWRSSENEHLANLVRRALGENKSIHAAPAHAFSADEQPDCWSLLCLCLYNGWDFTLLCRSHRIVIRGSHDEYLDVSATTRDELDGIRTVMKRLEVEEEEPAVRGIVAAREREHKEHALSAASELRQLIQASPSDLSLREKLASNLRELAFGSADDQALEELRQLTAAHPEQTPIRDQYAAALGADLYFAVQEGETHRADQVLNEIRHLTASHPADAAVRGVLARALAIVISSKQHDVAREPLVLELERLGESNPTEEEVQQWVRSAKQAETNGYGTGGSP